MVHGHDAVAPLPKRHGTRGARALPETEGHDAVAPLPEAAIEGGGELIGGFPY